MIASLREALHRLRDTPALWITGLYTGSLLCLVLLLDFQGDMVFGARVLFLGILALPFFLGGAYGVMRGEDRGVRAYLRAGARSYARILLAGAIVLAAAVATVILVTIPVALSVGTSQALAMPVVLGVLVPVAFFAFFADTAAVFEDRKVLDSIRRSVEFTLLSPWKVALFYLGAMALSILALFLSAVLWSFAVAESLLPVVEANQTALAGITPGELAALVGPGGIQAGLAIAFLAGLVLGSVLTAYKAVFFLRYAAPTAAPLQGEYDEKGRWYRY